MNVAKSRKFPPNHEIIFDMNRKEIGAYQNLWLKGICKKGFQNITVREDYWIVKKVNKPDRIDLESIYVPICLSIYCDSDFELGDEVIYSMDCLLYGRNKVYSIVYYSMYFLELMEIRKEIQLNLSEALVMNKEIFHTIAGGNKFLEESFK